MTTQFVRPLFHQRLYCETYFLSLPILPVVISTLLHLMYLESPNLYSLPWLSVDNVCIYPIFGLLSNKFIHLLKEILVGIRRRQGYWF